MGHALTGIVSTYYLRLIQVHLVRPSINSVEISRRRLHKYMLEVEHIGVISHEMREVVQSEWPELAYKLPPKKPRG